MDVISLAMYNTNDILYRGQKISCCLVDKALTLKQKIEVGSYCEDEVIKFQYAIAAIEVLEAYNPDSEENCITETQLDTLFNYLADYCGLCFPPVGFNFEDCEETN